MKVLNLYAGIGGNRKLWPKTVKVTAVEIEPEIAEIYKYYFPSDNVIVADAHDYLLKHYKKFDFIWTSPPCQTHSRLKKMPRYVDVKLWQEIIFLNNFSVCPWVAENVKPYYHEIILPAVELGRHLFWSNYDIPEKKFKQGYNVNDITSGTSVFDFHITGFKTKTRKDQILRNCVNPEIGLYILKSIYSI